MRPEAEMKTSATPSGFAALALPSSGVLTELTVSAATLRVERQRAVEFQREVYRREGLLRDDTLEPQVLPQASAEGSTIFVVRERDAIVGTVTFYMDSAMGLPMDAVHGEEVNEMRGRFARVAEVGGLAVMKDRRGVVITMMLCQAMFRWAVARDTECLVACVNPSSRRVYSRMLLFEVLGECKRHPRFLGAPSIPIGLDLTTAPERYRDAHGAEAENHLHKFFCETPAQYGFADLGSSPYLQSSDGLTRGAA